MEGTFNSNLLEYVAKLWLLFCLISSVSNKHNIIAQYSYDIRTLREISDGLSSNRQTGNFAYTFFVVIVKYNSLFGI